MQAVQAARTLSRRYALTASTLPEHAWCRNDTNRQGITARPRRRTVPRPAAAQS